MSDSPKRVMVTGSGGFIGRRAVVELARLGYDVQAVDLRPASATPGITSHEVDLLDAGQVGKLLDRVKPTHLIHFAWYAEHGKFWASPLNLDWVGASLALLRAFAASGGRRAVFAGTCAEYDWSLPNLHEDQTPSRPGTLYGVCKNSLREIATAFAADASIDLAWGRIFFLYGPDEHPKRFIPSILNPLLNDQRATLNCGAHIRDFMHVQDVAHAFAAILGSSLNGIVNVASGHSVALEEIGRLLGELTGRTGLLRIERAAGTPSNPQSLIADVKKLNSIGFSPHFSLRDGLADLVGRASGRRAQ